MTLSVNSTYEFGAYPIVVSTNSASSSTTNVMLAFNSVVANGGGTIFIQPGNYTFSGTFNLAGANVTISAPDNNSIGSSGIPATSVNFVGNQTILGSGSLTFKNITFQSSSGVVLSASPSSSSSIAFENCSILNSSGMALNITGADLTSSIAFNSCQLVGATGVASFTGSSISCFNTTFSAGTAAAVSLGTTTSMTSSTSRFSSTSFYAVVLSATSSTMSSTDSSYVAETSSVSCVNFTAAGSFTTVNDQYNSIASSGFYITTSNSSSGVVHVGNATLVGSSLQIHPLLITTYYISSNGAGLSWIDMSTSSVVETGSGSFVTSGITLTLPSPASQGNICSFIVDTTSPLIVQATGNQTIRLGEAISQAAGSATSSSRGDALTLVYRAIDTSWMASSAVGNWVVF